MHFFNTFDDNNRSVSFGFGRFRSVSFGFVRFRSVSFGFVEKGYRQETSRTADLGWDTHLTQNDSMAHTDRGQSTRQIATRSVQSFLHRDQVISRVGMSASCLVTTSTAHGCDRQTDIRMKNTLLN